MNMTNTTNTNDKVIAARGKCLMCPILLLGNAESLVIIKSLDVTLGATWILPYPAQHQIYETRFEKSEIIRFVFRARDSEYGTFLEQDQLLNPMKSTTEASAVLIENKKKYWKGSYIVTLTNSLEFKQKTNTTVLLNEVNNSFPIMQYDVQTNGVKKKFYNEVYLTPLNLKYIIDPKDANSCYYILTYIEELTGIKKVVNMSSNQNIILPSHRGAQIHIDCPNQHTDLKCNSLENNSWYPSACSGILQGRHSWRKDCGQNHVDVRILPTQSCSLYNLVACENDSHFGCLFELHCTSVSSKLPMFSCSNPGYFF